MTVGKLETVIDTTIEYYDIPTTARVNLPNDEYYNRKPKIKARNGICRNVLKFRPQSVFIGNSRRHVSESRIYYRRVCWQGELANPGNSPKT